MRTAEWAALAVFGGVVYLTTTVAIVNGWWPVVFTALATLAATAFWLWRWERRRPSAAR